MGVGPTLSQAERDFESRASTSSATRAGTAHRIERIIAGLCEFAGRAAGTDAERRAANHLATELSDLGRDASVEPTRVRPRYSLVVAAHLVLAVAGTVLSVYVAPAGFLMVLVAGVSLYGDLTTRFHLIRSLFPARASQNVTARGRNPEAPARLVVIAHYDAARSGLVFKRTVADRAVAIAKRLPFGVGPFSLGFWNVQALVVCALVRLFGVDAPALTVVQFVLTVPLIASLPSLVDIATSEVVPGANDNASGVAAAIELAARFDADEGRPASLDLWVVLPGAEEEFSLGMRAWLREHRREVEQKPTYFLNIDNVGYGDVRYLTAEGMAVLFDYDRGLVELCDEIAAAGSGGSGYGAAPYVSRLIYDGLVPRVHGHPAITVTCRGADGVVPTYHLPTDTPEAVDLEAVERATDFCAELIRRLDAKFAADLAAVSPAPS